ncbi:MAG: hypothetical protein HKN28_19055 [Alphaproteobacteria bacterium]|nr:hypothetical protein [Alphaproteobacteria bacterium]
MSRFFIALLLLIGLAGPALAMPDRLSGAEIKQWIDGNTVVGVWAGTPYRQLFRPDGTTAYDAAGTVRDEGRWWVTEDEYCSWWSSTGETCYQVLRDGEMLIWRTKGLFARTFDASVLPGNQLEIK